ncbi:MAG: aminopeptidase [Burkholderiaceae bacterium]|nr:aminopeptidase [Burkholderiaceae bacterium]
MNRPHRAATTARISFRTLCIVFCVFALAGCAAWRDGPAYYWQSFKGHLAVMCEARPIADLVDDPQVDPALRERLDEVLAIRAFASKELALPENGSYTAYADIGRPFVVWNVFATPELSMRLEQWCFPIAGCVGYRGYYDRDAADRYAQQLREDGFEAVVRGVPAYSTLGWFDDPVLSTFVHHPQAEVARLVFHELAHQVLYVKGDTTFNESFATAVEQIGVERWLAAREARTGDPKPRETWEVFAARRAAFLALLRRHRAALEDVYASAHDDDDKRRAKAAVFERLRSDYEELKRQWGGFAGYDRWFAQPLTNAHLASIGSYTDRVPAFRALFAEEGGDLPAFYRRAGSLGDLPKPERDAALDALAPHSASGSPLPHPAQ